MTASQLKLVYDKYGSRVLSVALKYLQSHHHAETMVSKLFSEVGEMTWLEFQACSEQWIFSRARELAIEHIHQIAREELSRIPWWPRLKLEIRHQLKSIKRKLSKPLNLLTYGNRPYRYLDRRNSQ